MKYFNIKRHFNSPGKNLRWVVWSLAASFSLYVYLSQIWPSVMIPDLSQAFHLDAAGIGLLSSAFFYSYLPMQIPAGMMMDKFGPRRVLVSSIVLCGLAVIMFAFANSLAVAETSRIIMGFAASPSIAATLYLSGNWFPPARFALMVGLTEMTAMLGGVVGQFGLAQSVVAYGWQGTVIGVGVFALVLGFFIWLVVYDRPSDDPEPEELLQQKRQKLNIKALFRLPQVWLVGILSGFIFVLPSAFAGLWCVPFLRDLYGVSVKYAAFASSMVFIGIAIGGPVTGWFSDRIGRRKPVIIAGSFLTLGVLLVILYVPISFFTMTILLLLLGLLCSEYVLAFAIGREITPPSVRGTGMAFINLLSIILGAPLLQPLIGYLLELNSNGQTLPNLFPLYDYKIALAVLPACVFIALILSFFVKETYCREQYA